MMVIFDSAIHLAYQKPARRHTMAELGLKNGISDIGVTDPFPFLSAEGVRALRADIFSKNVLDKYVISSYLASCQIRGMDRESAQFIHDLWTHPDTLKACSEAAGIDLVPIMPYELGHTNVQTPSRNAIKETLASLGPEPLPALVPSTESDSDSSDEEEAQGVEPVVHWHNDSYPWVCVVMLSDCSTMRGGETAIECGDGSVKKIRGPGLGFAVMMQGRYIRHSALNAFGAPERVTMVTSFRARDPEVRDESVLTTIRPISKLDPLYFQWVVYRMNLLAERFRKRAQDTENEAIQNTNDNPDSQQPFDKELYKVWARDQIAYLQTTIDEIV